MHSEFYDYKLQTLKNLSWLPWVGKDYPTLSSENKILFIGESHYLTESKNNNAKYNKSNMTRLIVKDMGIDGNEWNSKFFSNVHRLIFGKKVLKEEQNNLFWDKIAFYNFIQKPMSNSKSRPTYLELETGRDNFFDLIRVLKPSVCIFLGLKAEFKMNEAIERSGFAVEKKIEWKDRIGTSYGRFGSIKNNDGEVIKIVFIRHPSSYFNPQRWNEFLTKYIPSRMNWLKNLNN